MTPTTKATANPNLDNATRRTPPTEPNTAAAAPQRGPFVISATCDRIELPGERRRGIRGALCPAGDTQPPAEVLGILVDDWAACEPARALSRKGQDFF
jgi:hypothetical protein